MAGVCWRCQMLYQCILFCLFIFLPTQVCLLFLPFLLASFTFPACQRIFFSPLYDCYTLKHYWRCFKCNSECWTHYFHVRTDVMCTHHGKKKISFLFGLWQLFPFVSLKHLDLPSSYVFFSSRSDTQMWSPCEECQRKCSLSSESTEYFNTIPWSFDQTCEQQTTNSCVRLYLLPHNRIITRAKYRLHFFV